MEIEMKFMMKIMQSRFSDVSPHALIIMFITTFACHCSTLCLQSSDEWSTWQI